MGTFITDGSSVLPDVKTDARPSSGATTEWAAVDANEVRSALLDLRTAALAVQSGFVNPNVAEVTSSGTPGATKALQDWMAVVEAGGGGSGTVTAVSGSSPIGVTNPTTTPAISISEASAAARGTMSAAHYTKLNDLGAATSSVAGTMSAADKTKLDAFPAVTGGTTQYLRADGTWYVPAGGGGGSVTEVTGTSPISVATGTTTPVVSLGTVPVSSGGTGASSLTANNVILGNGTSAVQAVAPGTSGNVLTSNGTTWASAANAPAWTAVTGKPTVIESVGGSGAISTTGTTSITVSIATASSSATGALSSTDWSTFNAKLGTSDADTAATANKLAKRTTAGELNATDFVATSDSRLKSDISQIVGALAKVTALRGCTFKKISDPTRFRIGLIAQETLQVVPEAVYESAEAEHYLSVNYGSLVGLLVEAVKELSEKVAALEAARVAP